MLLRLLLVPFLFLCCLSAKAQQPLTFYDYPDTVHTKRLRYLMLTEAAIYSSTMYGLYTLWYKDFPQSKFHWFNDNDEWLQIDKVGHAMSAYEIGRFCIEAFKWSGVDSRKSAIYGGLIGFAYQGNIEVFDGFSAGWGASPGDIIANASGTALVMGQELAWEEQRAQLKVSSWFTDFAQYRPHVFGKTWTERLFKDYNGQTYWLSVNPSTFAHKDSKLPKWLAVSFGYGGTGMTGGTTNPTVDADGNPIPSFERRRQYYLSLDVDFTHLETKSRFLNTVLHTFGFIKVPFPALEWNAQDGFRGHALYF